MSSSARRFWILHKPNWVSLGGVLLVSWAIAQFTSQGMHWLLLQGLLVWGLSRYQGKTLPSAPIVPPVCLADTHQTLQALVRACPLAITVFSLDGEVQLWNPAAERIFGWSANEAVGQFLPSIPPAKRTEFLANLDEIRRGESIEGLRSRRLCKNGDPIEVEIWAAPIVDAAGNVSCMSIVADISERSRIEAERHHLIEREQLAQADREHAREQLFKTLESITDGFVAYDCNWHIAYINTKGAQALGNYTPEQLQGRSVWEAFPELKQSPFGHLLQQAMAEGKPLELEEFYAPLEAWFAMRAYPSAAGVALYFRNVTTRRQTAERLKLALQDEQAARREAEAANRRKDEFLMTLSHELRTPLNIIQGWTQLLQSRRFNPDSASRAIDAIDRNARSLSQLIEDLLAISRIITGNLRLNQRSLDLNRTLAAAIALMQPAAAAKNLQLTWQFEAIDGWVVGDAELIQKLMWHLLSNAIKFTPEGGLVQVRLEQVNEWSCEGTTFTSTHSSLQPAPLAQITVSDTGEGIPPEFLPHVFDRFRQADSSITRSYGGLGLGMAIVRHLVELHGGTVTANSGGIGKGSTFTVLLPIANCSQSTAPSTNGYTANGHDLQAEVQIEQAMQIEQTVMLQPVSDQNSIKPSR